MSVVQKVSLTPEAPDHSQCHTSKLVAKGCNLIVSNQVALTVAGEPAASHSLLSCNVQLACMSHDR